MFHCHKYVCFKKKYIFEAFPESIKVTFKQMLRLL